MEANLFDVCQCKGFYKKAHDGIYIELDREKLTADAYTSASDVAIESDCDRIEKTYYEYVKANCRGVIVGFVDVVVKGFLDVIYNDAYDTGIGMTQEEFYVTKTPKEIVRCAIVYYANNKKHYVPLDDIEKVTSN